MNVKFTNRECDVALAVLFGNNINEIAVVLNISFFSVKNHLNHIYRKLNFEGRGKKFKRFQLWINSIKKPVDEIRQMLTKNKDSNVNI